MFGLILVVPATLMLVMGIFRIMFKASEQWEKDSRKITKGISVAIKTVIKGIRMVVSFAKEKVIPKTVETCKSILEKIKGGFDSKIVESQMVAN